MYSDASASYLHAERKKHIVRIEAYTADQGVVAYHIQRRLHSRPLARTVESYRYTQFRARVHEAL